MALAEFLYLEGASVIHRLDPRVKLGGLLVVFCCLLLPQSLPVVAGGTAGVALVVTLGRAWGNVGRISWLLAGLGIFTTGIWAVLATGPTPLWGPVSREGLVFGLATAMKLAGMLLAGLVLLTTTRVEEMFVALVRLRVPYAVSFALALALRWVPEVFATVRRVTEAQEARGCVRAPEGWAARLKGFLPLLIPIFLLTLRRSQTMALALEARGFQARRERTYFLELRWQGRDWVAVGVLLICLGGSVYLHAAGLDQIAGLRLP